MHGADLDLYCFTALPGYIVRCGADADTDWETIMRWELNVEKG